MRSAAHNDVTTRREEGPHAFAAKRLIVNDEGAEWYRGLRAHGLSRNSVEKSFAVSRLRR